MDMQQCKTLLQPGEEEEGEEEEEEGEEEEEKEKVESCTGRTNNVTQCGFTLRSRRRQRPKQTMDTCSEDDDVSCEVGCAAVSHPAISTARCQVSDIASPSSSSEAPSEEESQHHTEEISDGDDNDNNASNSTNNMMTIRLNKVCEAACVDILMDWARESSLTNDSVESKTLSHSGKGEENNDNVLLNPLSYYAHMAKDLIEIFVFTVILVTFVYGVWLMSTFWYDRTTINSHEPMYPLVRIMRITSLAFLLNYPNVQELYEEGCILQNPFYDMNDVSCWPCENVRDVLDFTGLSNFTGGYFLSGVPFIVKDALSKDVHFEDVYNLLKGEPTSNLTSTAHLLSNHPEIETFDQLNEWTRRKDLNDELVLGRKIHVTWKLNRVEYARMMRTLFHRPYYIPQETEISVQYFLFIDELDAESYPLPITEFENVFLMQGDGPRLVVLEPIRHCQNVCKPIRVLLEPRDVLYYNWLFWRPIISPVKTEGMTNHTLSITYVGSFY